MLSQTFDEHLENLKTVFERLRQYGLRANRDKCDFASSRVKYLGHVITVNGISPDPEKINAILDMLPPRIVKHVMSFLTNVQLVQAFCTEFR